MVNIFMSNAIKVKTRDFDEIEIPENEIIHFAKGIFAFEDQTKYVLLAPRGENQFPMWLRVLKTRISAL